MKKLLFILAFTFTTASCFADISVKDFGARGDGVTDDTKAFTAALEAAAKNGGGIVKAPAGTYCIKGNLNIPTAVTLEGTWRAPRTWGGKPTETEKNGAIGSTLLAYAGRFYISNVQGYPIWRGIYVDACYDIDS